ncbi:hypothetical protein ACVOMV_07630 [Mesorhizobium atlanticum]
MKWIVIGAALVAAAGVVPALADTPLVGIVSISATEANNARYIVGAKAAAKEIGWDVSVIDAAGSADQRQCRDPEFRAARLGCHRRYGVSLFLDRGRAAGGQVGQYPGRDLGRRARKLGRRHKWLGRADGCAGRRADAEGDERQGLHPWR